MLRPRLLLIAALLAAPALSFSQSRGTTVSGTVYDSVARTPLGGAIVQIVQVDSAAASRNFTATADARGSFRIDGLPRGKFGIGFQHNALDALGLESPLRAFQVGT